MIENEAEGYVRLQDNLPEVGLAPDTPLKVYLLTQRELCGYDTYDSCVVIAASDSDAQLIHPGGDNEYDWDPVNNWSWVSKDDVSKVNVTELGLANSEQVAGTVICASYNAG